MANIKLISVNTAGEEGYAPDRASLLNRSLHLSLEVREDKVLACLLDKDIKQYIAWASFNRKPERDTNRTLESIAKEEMLNYEYAGCSVVFTRNAALIIPSGFFAPEAVKDYLEQQNLIMPGEIPCHDFIKNNDSYSAYAVNSADFSALKEKFPQAVFRHHSSVFIEYLLASARLRNNLRIEVHVAVFPSYMDVVALQPGKLILYNRYNYQTSNDFAYFLLWVYEELKLKPEDSPCFFYGDIMEKSEPFTLTWRYLKNVRLVEKTTLFSFSPMLENLSPHRYYSLFMQYLCI